MVRSLIAVIVSAGCMCASLGALAGEEGPKPLALAQIIQREGDAFVKTGATDGLSIAIVYDGKAQYFNFGTTTRGKLQQPSPDTVYEIARSQRHSRRSCSPMRCSIRR
jgi:CubicO group peptidase (beta-lactamase class C family)